MSSVCWCRTLRLSGLFHWNLVQPAHLWALQGTHHMLKILLEARLDVFSLCKAACLLKRSCLTWKAIFFLFFLSFFCLFFSPVALGILQIDNLWPLENLTKLQLDNNFIEKIEGLESLVHLVWLGEIQAEEGGCLHRCKTICDKPGCHLPSQTRLIGAYPGKAVSCLCVSLFDCQMSKCLSIRAAKQFFKCLKTGFNTFGVAGTGSWGFKVETHGLDCV